MSKGRDASENGGGGLYTRIHQRTGVGVVCTRMHQRTGGAEGWGWSTQAHLLLAVLPVGVCMRQKQQRFLYYSSWPPLWHYKRT